MNQENPPDIRIRKAPAKLNLTLRVTGRRDDGFHEIDTLMVPLPGLHDVLTFSPADELQFISNDASLPDGDGNLVVRAARAFAEAAGIGLGVRIHLEKRIPSGAGLGGGSSDAAATLLALQEMHDQPLAEAAMHEVAASIGSDVPFFLQDGPARCTGRGEVVTSAPEALPQPMQVLLLKPTFPVATVDAYRRVLDPALDLIPGVPMTSRQIEELNISNDLERPVFAKHRFLAELKIWLADRPECRAAIMTGSGSTVFAILKPGTDPATIARAASQELDPTLWHWLDTIG